MERVFWRRCRTVGALWMGCRKWIRRQDQVGPPRRTADVGFDRLLNGRFDEAQKRRIPAFQANGSPNAARPQAGRRRHDQLVWNIQLDFLDAVAWTVRLVGPIEWHELKKNAVIEQQTRRAETWILDGDRPLSA